MKPLLLLLSAVLVLNGGSTRAEKADRGKAMNVEADSLRYDDLKQTSVFSGRVVLTKGSILIRGGKIDVHQDAQGYQYGVVSAESGKLAFFRQKREGLDEFIEGEGETIEYDGRADVVKFTRKAQLRRYRGATLNDELSGDVILYNNSTEVFTIDGTPAQASPGAAAGRVRAMLSPKPEVLSAGVPKANDNKLPAPAPTLRATTTFGEGKK